MLPIAIREGLVDEAYVAARTTGFDAVRRAVRSDWPDRVERTTGIPVTEMIETVRAIATARTAMILTACGAEQHADGTDTVQAWINLALALRLTGRGPGSGLGTLTGQGNGQGGREHGQKADQLPGYRKLTAPADRVHVAAVWGSTPTSCPVPASRSTRCWTGWAPTAGPGHCWSPRPIRWSRPPTPATSAGASMRSTCWSSPTSSAPRPPSGPMSSCPPPSGPRRTAP